MARIRSIKPEFPQSESMGRVSRDARLTFVLLWTIADDEGRLRGNSRMLASLLFPYDDDASDLIDGWLKELEVERCIIRYQANDASYVQVLNWLNHQKIDKPSRSKIPPFDEASRSLANIPEASPLDQGSKDQGSRKGSGGRAADAALIEEFKIWYQVFPIHVAPGDAERAYLKARKAVDAETLLTAAKAYAAKPDRDPKFTKHPATWLNKKCWLDDIGESAPVKADPDKVLRDKAGLVMRGLKSQRTIITQEDYAEMVRLKMVTEEQAQDHGYRPKSDSPAPSFKIPTPGSQFTNAPVAPNTRRDVA